MSGLNGMTDWEFYWEPARRHVAGLADPQKGSSNKRPVRDEAKVDQCPLCGDALKGLEKKVQFCSSCDSSFSSMGVS